MKNPLRACGCIAFAFMMAFPEIARAESDSGPSPAIEGIFWRPAGFDYPVIQPASPAGPQAIGSSQGITHNFSPGYRLSILWKNIRASWLDLQTETSFSAQCPSNSCIPSQRGPTGVFVGQPLASASAWSAMRLQIFDLDFLERLSTNSNSNLTASFGLRYARIYNGTDTFYRSSPNTDELQSRLINNMIGLRTGLEGCYPIGSMLRLTASAAVSILNGSSHEDATENYIPPGGPQTSQTGSTISTIAPATEIGMKLTYTPIRNFDTWLGYDFLQFTDGLAGQTFVGSGGNFTSLETRRNVAFMGPRLGLRWQF